MSVNKIRARTYAKLLGNEIAFLVDKIALNVYTRDQWFPFTSVPAAA